MAVSSNKAVASRLRRRQRTQKPLPKVHAISVKGLFGKYDFPEFQVSSLDSEHTGLAFLYGDNGVGKTTILSLLYALLSTERNGGLRGFLLKTKFSEFAVTFDDGQRVSVIRPKGTTEGDLKYVFSGPRFDRTISLSLNERGRVATADNPDVPVLISILEEISPILVFVNDARTVRSSYEPWNVRTFLNERFFSAQRAGRYVLDAQMRPIEADVDVLASAGLDQLLQQSHAMLRDRAFRDNAAANAGTGQIYASIARTIARSNAEEKPSKGSYDRLISRIVTAQEHLIEYASYGLLQGDHLDDIARYVTSAPQRAREQIVELIEPYVASLEKRIDASKSLANQMLAFERGVNSFLRRKSMVCRLNEPIGLVDDKGVTIESSSLSSGERHLVYLCCVAMLSREMQCLIIVDEPELSLNYKWQRELVRSMLDISNNSAQFLMATHSFEIISEYSSNAIDLEPVVA